jgi:hypothetical protein
VIVVQYLSFLIQFKYREMKQLQNSSDDSNYNYKEQNFKGVSLEIIDNSMANQN